MSDIEEKYDRLLRFLGVRECWGCRGTGQTRTPYPGDCTFCLGEGFLPHGWRVPKVDLPAHPDAAQREGA